MKKLSQVVCMIVATLITCTMLSACASENDIRKNGYDEAFGARPLKRFIQDTIETEVAKTILADDLPAGYTITVDAKGDNLIVK